MVKRLFLTHCHPLFRRPDSDVLLSLLWSDMKLPRSASVATTPRIAPTDVGALPVGCGPRRGPHAQRVLCVSNTETTCCDCNRREKLVR